MPEQVAVAIWSLSTTTKECLRLSIEERLELLDGALQKVGGMIEHGKSRSTGFESIFAAPEYLFSARSEDGTRSPMTNQERLRLEQALLNLSKKYPRTILFPGTLYYGKPLVRASDDPAGKFGATGVRDQAKSLVDRRQKLLGRFPELMKAERWGERGTAKELIAEGKFLGDEKPGEIRPFSPSLAQLSRVLSGSRAPLIARNVALMLVGGRRLAKYDKQVDSWDANGAQPEDLMFVPGTTAQCPVVDGSRFGVEVCADHALGMLNRRHPGRLSFHVLLSDFTDTAYNEAGTSGGHLIHASTQPLMAYVYDPGLTKIQPEIREDYAQKSQLRLWYLDPRPLT